MSADPYAKIDVTLTAAQAHIAQTSRSIGDRPYLALGCLHQALADLVALTKRQHPYYPGGDGPRANTPDSRRQPGESDEDYLLRVRGHVGPPPLVGVADPSPIAPIAICGVIANSGRVGEPLACGKVAGHEGPHAWATLPTFDDEGDTDNDRLARHRGVEIARLEAEVARLRSLMDAEFGKNAFLRQKLHGASEQFLALNDLMVETAERVRAIAQSPQAPYTPGESAPREGAPSEE